jgi:hypothetical protein
MLISFKDYLNENNPQIEEYDKESTRKEKTLSDIDATAIQMEIKAEEDNIKKNMEIVNYVKSKFSSAISRLKGVDDENDKGKILKECGVLDKQDIEKVNKFLTIEKEIKDKQEFIKHLKDKLSKIKK